MRLRMPPAFASLSVLLALTDNAFANSHASDHATNKQEQDNPADSMIGPFQGVRSLTVSSKVRTCKTTDPSKAEVTAFVEMVEDFYQEPKGSSGPLQLPQITVEVNFVVVSASDQQGATSKQVQDQIDVLNSAFSPNFLFILKTLKEVTNNNYFYNVEDSELVEAQMKREHRKGGMETLNVYAVKMQYLLGWATFPFDKNRVMDGVVLNYESVPNGALVEFNEGDVSTEYRSSGPAVDFRQFSASTHVRISCWSVQTLIHEVGHWLGLFHTFQGGCNPPGDGISDTPAEEEPHFECDDPLLDSCPLDPGLDPLDNYMSYSLDVCMFKFTPEQLKAMRAAWSKYRAVKIPAPTKQPTTAPVNVPIKVKGMMGTMMMMMK
jgi:Pregnancy-associated plasma protein-A